jgi:hypothetical protein
MTKLSGWLRHCFYAALNYLIKNLRQEIQNLCSSFPGHFYTVMTHTGIQPDAGTTANVFVQLIGNQGTTEELPLNHAGTKEFQPGQ